MKFTDYPINIIKKEQQSYPRSLLKVYKPPTRIFTRGSFSKNILRKSIAIVGSRRMTRYGREVIDRFTPFFVSEKVTTISGFMYGVDTEVHKKTLDYGGVTIAVFGCGLDCLYPPENDKLYAAILENGGAIISEYEPKAKPHLWKFPQRNRIVSGLSTLGVLIVEAGEKSGSLVTARIALSQGKKVYAVPGPITSTTSKGTNLLIKKGEAICVTEPNDILRSRTKALEDKELKIDLTPEEKLIWEALRAEPLNPDELSMQVGVGITELSATLSLMSLKGLITESGGKYYLA